MADATIAPGAIVRSRALMEHFALGAGIEPTPDREMAPPTAHLREADYEDR